MVTERIRRLIHRGELAPGDRLPAERLLAEELGIARVSLREALARLQQEGYLIARRGAAGGTFVTELVEPRRHWLQRVRENLGDLEDLLDFRIALETHAARLAARRAQPTDLAAIDRAVRQLSAVTDIASFRSADTAFHDAVADAAGSARLRAAIDEARGQLFLPTDSLIYPPDVELSRRYHRRIARAVRRRAETAAAAAMYEHIESTRAWLRQILSEPDPFPQEASDASKPLS